MTDEVLGETADWTNKVELADVDLDGDVDLLFANGGDDESPGTPVASRVFLNDGSGHFDDATRKVLGGFKGLTRVMKAADVDGDGRPDDLVLADWGKGSPMQNDGGRVRLWLWLWLWLWLNDGSGRSSSAPPTRRATRPASELGRGHCPRARSNGTAV